MHVLFVIQRPKEKKCYIADGLPDEEIDGKYNFSVEEKLVSTKFSDVPKFYIELNGSGAFMFVCYYVTDMLYRTYKSSAIHFSFFLFVLNHLCGEGISKGVIIGFNAAYMSRAHD